MRFRRLGSVPPGRLLTAAMMVLFVDPARLVIQQNRLENGFQVALDTGTVVIENRGDAGDVARAWITAHQALDQLATDERCDVRMREQDVERHRQTGDAIGAGWDRRSQECLRAQFMQRRVGRGEKCIALHDASRSGVGLFCDVDLRAASGQNFNLSRLVF